MRIWLVEILVRLGVAVIADGRCRPRWYGSDQRKVCKREQSWCWVYAGASWRRGVAAGPYYSIRHRVTGSNWQAKQYRKGASLAILERLKSC